MSKPTTFAKEEVMEAYLTDLLAEQDLVDEKQAKAAKLLADAEILDVPKVDKEPAPALDISESDSTSVESVSAESTQDAAEAIIPVPTAPPLVETLDEEFQALFFNVAGLTLAVPLITLGGIHKLDKVGPLFGKPDWFMGVMLHREEKLNVVNSAKWVMPEKVTAQIEDNLSYEYLVMLANSEWGLACETLVNTVTLNKQDIKWRTPNTKRPWLAGMVKERMCALIDVYQLISMLNKGLGSDDT